MLRLQKIELLGFKSFADRTEITFDDQGVVAIVGPNGCGKSNVSDAVNWVLGEQSARSLRTGRMLDVIFNGTPGRKPTGMAEVSMTLLDPEVESANSVESEVSVSSGVSIPGNGHNGTHKSSQQANATGGVIRIARRLFRSGESEYLLNGRACRLRDIQEIFLGTGQGSATYATIEQGRIGQVISAKPYELRALLEEAAGITKFKAKRKLAWAKLESSKQNLARVNDILEEIRRQVNSLQRQAAKARRYGELRGQLQGQLRLLLASRYRETEQQATRAALEVSLLSGSLREQLERIDAQEKQQQAGQELCRRDEAELRQAVEDRSALRVAAERARSQFAAQSQQVQYLNNRIEEAATELEQWRAQREAFEQERNACASVLETIRAESATLHELHRRQSQESLACQRQLTEKADRLEQLRQQMLETVHRCATLHNQVAQIEQFLETTARQTEQAEGRLAAAETAQESAERNREESQAAVMQHHAALEELAGQRNRLEESLRTARAEQAQQRDLLEQLRAELAAGQARLQSLGEILARRAYTSETVQRLFEAQTAESPHVLPRVGHPAGGTEAAE